MTIPAVMKRPGVVRGVVQRRQDAREIEVLGVHDLLRRCFVDHDGRLRIAKRAANQVADIPEWNAERGLAIGLARQQVADDRHVMADDIAEEERRAAIELLHHAGDLEVRIGRRAIDLQPPALRHTIERGAKACVQCGIRDGQMRLPLSSAPPCGAPRDSRTSCRSRARSRPDSRRRIPCARHCCRRHRGPPSAPDAGRAPARCNW